MNSSTSMVVAEIRCRTMGPGREGPSGAELHNTARLHSAPALPAQLTGLFLTLKSKD